MEEALTEICPNNVTKPMRCEAYDKNAYPIPIVPIEISDTRPQEGAANLLRLIRSNWDPENIRYTVSTLL